MIARISPIALLFALASDIGAQVSVPTYHNDPQRTGWNSHEITLNPSNVAPNSFGWIQTVALDDQVDTQPLVVANVSVPGKGVHTVVYVTTENNTVYAIDAGNGANLITPRHLGGPIVFNRTGMNVHDPLSCFNNGPTSASMVPERSTWQRIRCTFLLLRVTPEFRPTTFMLSISRPSMIVPAHRSR
jgi:hypothetical protein